MDVNAVVEIHCHLHMSCFVHAGTDGLAAYGSGILDALQSCQHQGIDAAVQATAGILVGFCCTGNILCCCAPFDFCLKTAFLAFVVDVCVQRLRNQFLLAADGCLLVALL